MVIVYDSKTGNVKRFIKKLEAENPNLFCIPIEEYNYNLGPFHFITHTTGQGMVPQSSINFLYDTIEVEQGSFSLGNLVNLQSVSSSGNKNWGKNFARAAELIQTSHYGLIGIQIPILLRFELSGTVQDVKTYLEKLKTYGKKMDSSQ